MTRATRPATPPGRATDHISKPSEVQHPWTLRRTLVAEVRVKLPRARALKPATRVPQLRVPRPVDRRAKAPEQLTPWSVERPRPKLASPARRALGPRR